MEKIKIEVSLNKMEVLNFIKKYHYNEKDMERILIIYKNIIQVIAPGIYIKYVEKDSKKRLTFLKEDSYVVLMATLGDGIDMVLEQYHRNGEIWEEYAIECLSMELLLKIYEEAETEIFKLTQQYPVKYIFFGDDGKMEHMKEVFLFLQQYEISYNNAFALLPSKSVVFTTILQPKKSQHTRIICADCSNLTCENRKLVN